jgi:hypothetical protein
LQGELIVPELHAIVMWPVHDLFALDRVWAVLGPHYSWRFVASTQCIPKSTGYPAVAREGDPLLFLLQWVREEPRGTDAYLNQYGEGLSGEPACLHAV